MARQEINVSLYPNVEVMLTGHIADFHKKIGKAEWLIQCWRGETAKIFKDGAAFQWDQCPLAIKRYHNAAIEWLNASRP